MKPLGAPVWEMDNLAIYSLQSVVSSAVGEGVWHNGCVKSNDPWIPRCARQKPVLTVAGLKDVLPGYGLELLASASLPTAAETRDLLLRLRREHQLARGHLAALLCVPTATLRRWEEGVRSPSAAARRCVQLVSRCFFFPGSFPVAPLANVLTAIQPDLMERRVRAMERANRTVG